LTVLRGVKKEERQKGRFTEGGLKGTPIWGPPGGVAGRRETAKKISGPPEGRLKGEGLKGRTCCF